MSQLRAKDHLVSEAVVHAGGYTYGVAQDEHAHSMPSVVEQCKTLRVLQSICPMETSGENETNIGDRYLNIVNLQWA